MENIWLWIGIGLVGVLLIGGLTGGKQPKTSQPPDQSEGQTYEKEDWMKDEKTDESTDKSSGGDTRFIQADATLVRDSETNVVTQIKLKNTSPATWKNIKVVINSGLFGGGYSYEYPIVGPHTEITIAIRKFAKSDGTRFNPYTTKINKLDLHATVNGYRDLKIFQG